MAISDPVAIFNAANNSEAHVVRLLLEQNGVEASVVEDVSPVGLFMFGFLPQIHNPQVWVDLDSVELAKPILEEFEQGPSGASQAEPDCGEEHRAEPGGQQPGEGFSRSGVGPRSGAGVHGDLLHGGRVHR